jgi:cyclase
MRISTILSPRSSVAILSAVAALGTVALSELAKAQGGAGKGKGGGQAKAAQQTPASPPNPAIAATEIHSLKVKGNVYMLVGAGSNMAVQIGPQGVFVVDTMYAELSPKILAEIKKLTDKPIRYIVDTTFDPDHTGGNANLNRAGAPIVGGNLGAVANDRGAAIIAHENVLMRMSAPTGGTAPTPEASWPNTTYFEGQKEVYLNGEAIITMHHPNAHTDGDSFVHFRGSDVVATGDAFNTTSFPVVNLEAGGNIQGVIATLNHVLDIAIPEHEQEGGTMIIPGHGRLCDEHDLLEYRDMVTIIRDRVQAMIMKGMSLDQVKAANPTKEYDPRYGSKTGPWTTDMFVEAVYKSLKK